MAKRDAIENIISKFCSPPDWADIKGDCPLDILVIRNNDIGDLILTTPLFQALKDLFPASSLHVGIGDWNKGLLDHNPHVDKVVPLNAPWHNKVSCKHSPNSPFGFLKSMFYIFFSPEARAIHSTGFGLGIDVLGSQEGSVLMHRCGIPRRMGAKGYGGGHTGCQRYREFQMDQSVSLSILEYAKILGMSPTALPPPKPQLHLSQAESRQGLVHWDGSGGKKRIVVSTGAGFAEKCWPFEFFVKVAEGLSSDLGNEILFVGAKADQPKGNQLKEAVPGVANLAGLTTLRETFAIISHADLVVCNSTMFMHVAAAFDIRNLVLLGPWYDSAQLHTSQWGHPRTTILGREIKEGRNGMARPDEVLQLALDILEEGNA